jgi:hypothetical protein
MICFPCPSCQRVLRFAEEQAGRPANCPDCASPVTVPAGSSEAVKATAITTVPAASPIVPLETAVTAKPASPTAAPPWLAVHSDNDAERAGWGMVRTGLRLMQLSVVVRVGILMVLVLLMIPLFQRLATPEPVPGRFSASPSPTFESENFQVLLILAGLGAELLQLIGAVFLLQVPEQTRCRPYAVAMAICQSMVLAGAVLSQARLPAAVAHFVLLLELVAAVAGLVLLIILLIFLHRIGTLLGSNGLRKQVERYALMFAIAFVVVAASIAALVVGLLKHPSEIVVLIGLVVVLVSAALMLVMQANLLRSAREVIQRRALRPANDS